MRARSSGHACALGAQNQCTTTRPAASLGDGTSYSQSSLGHDGVPSSGNASPTTGNDAGTGLPGLAALLGAAAAGDGALGMVVGCACATVTDDVRATTRLANRTIGG